MTLSNAARKLAAARKTRGAGAGRPKMPAHCAKCGTKCEGTREARTHCAGGAR